MISTNKIKLKIPTFCIGKILINLGILIGKILYLPSFSSFTYCHFSPSCQISFFATSCADVCPKKYHVSFFVQLTAKFNVED
jgi:hypothetical protein